MFHVAQVLTLCMWTTQIPQAYDKENPAVSI